MYRENDDNELPDQVIVDIHRILQINNADTSDPLDVLSNNFSPLDVLNDFFPDEASLGQIDSVQAQLAQTELQLQQEINELQNELRKDQDPDRMMIIQEMISDLLSQMSLIREKATESEAVVRNITQDIQVLDLAKKNLILSMTTLKRLQMLVNALTQLESLLAQKSYPEIAQSLSAVKQLSASFKPYTSVKKVAVLWKRVLEVQGELRAVLEKDFDAFFLQTTPHPSPSQISSACLAVDVLSPDVRTALVGRYVALELKDYKRVFRVASENAEASGLDNIDRRFAWFRRMLGRHEVEQGRVFPEEWKVGWALVGGFVDVTRDDLAAVLSKAGKNLTVKVLLDTLQLVTEFEGSMSRKWAVPFQQIISHTPLSSNPNPKPISNAFEPHTGIFVDAQDKNVFPRFRINPYAYSKRHITQYRALADMLSPHRRLRPSLEMPKTPLSLLIPDPPSHQPDQHHQQAQGQQEEEEPTVLPSSTELFYFYGQSLDQCQVKLGTGKVMWELGKVWGKWLRVYAEDVLGPKMKRPVVHRRSTETRYDPNELKQICLIINTADYCQTTAAELEEKIREKINEEYKEKITFQVERDLFVSVISSAITLLLTHLESTTDPFFTQMSRTSYLLHTQVSGPSAWMGEMVRGIEGVVGVVKDAVQGKKYVRNFLDKCASLMLAKFTGALVKSRPLREIGAEQLLIDLQAIKECLLKLPGENLTSSSYTRGLTKSTTRLEALLKVIVTPVDPPEAFILNYTILIGDASFSNFQKILDLKGTPKATQNDLLDSFLTITSTRSELDSTSFLTSLDMDPSSTASLTAHGLASPGGSRASLPLTGDNREDGGGAKPGEGKREVFSDFKRFVSFGLSRRDSVQVP